ncbi:hypothetical protein BLA3211_06947 [Burkholderia aenigmatica]|uniref:Uncharacterized protein n=1 Tax=Burkholderia aenigmatica TaxID=2015348 RepID=A0A6J5JKX8_9BURK|nr:hypothetical protein BLA3211_06947 [Burkholderia aenigmatica]
MALGIRMARRLLILVPRPARNATDLIGNRHRTLSEIRVELVRFAVIGPVAHDTCITADTLPLIETLQATTQRVLDHQSMLIRKAPTDMAATIRNGHQFAGMVVRVPHQRVGLFTVNTTGQLDRGNTLRMQLVVGQCQQATGAIVQSHGPHNLIVSFSLHLDPVAVPILEAPQLERFTIRIGTSTAEIAIHAIDRFDHIVATLSADQVNAFRHAEMALTRRHRRKHDIAPLLVPVRDRCNFVMFAREPQLDADRHAPSRPEQAVGTIIEAAIEALPNDRQRPGQHEVGIVRAIENLAAGDDVNRMPRRRPRQTTQPGTERTRRKIDRKTRHLALQKVAPTHLPAATHRERDTERRPQPPEPRSRLHIPHPLRPTADEDVVRAFGNRPVARRLVANPRSRLIVDIDAARPVGNHLRPGMIGTRNGIEIARLRRP